LPSPLNSEHRSRVYFNLLRRASGVELEYVQPKLLLNDNDTQDAHQLLSGFGIQPEDNYAVIAFRAVAESRRWSPDRYAELALWFTEKRRMKVVLAGTEEDRKTGDQMIAGTGDDQIVNLAGKTTLRELAAVFSGARVFVGNDSGPAHLAAAVGVSLVILSGADDPKETSPISDRKRLLYRDNLECISCVKNKCANKGEDFMRCMEEITVPSVISQIEAVLGDQ